MNASSPDLPHDVQAFIRDHVESHEQVQILRWLKVHETTAHSAERVAEAVGIPAIVASEAMLALHRQLLLTSTDGLRRFQLAPATPELARGVDELLEYAAADPVGLMKIMIDNAMARLRHNAGSFFFREVRRGMPRSD
jgi:hypothetical protein